MGFWNKIIVKEAESWIFKKLEESQTPGDISSQKLPPESAYLEIFLKSMWIVNSRIAYKKFYGVVHSFMTIPHRSGPEPARFNVVTTPTELKGVDPRRIDRVISFNHRLLGPIPYTGGDFGLQVGLFSVKQADLAEPFLSLLESMSKAAGVSYINAAMPFVEPIREGIDLLTGSTDDTKLEIGVSSTAFPVKTGYYVVMRAPKGTVDMNQYRLDKSDFGLVYPNGLPVKEYPYMVLAISSSTRRDAWQQIPEISKAYNLLRADMGDSQKTTQEKREALNNFKRVVLLNDDLLEEDQGKLCEKIETRMNVILELEAVPKGDTLPYLEDISLD